MVRQESPFFSITIPTYERPRQLAACLHALARLDYPRARFEVIIVDDGGQAFLEPVVRPFADRFTATLLRQTHAGPATARNTGAHRARGRYLVFTDDDCAPAANWLRALEARLAAAPEDAVVGHTVNALTNNLYAAASQHLVSFLLTYHRVDTSRVRFWTTSNLALPADKFRLVGGFDPAFPFPGGEDSELCARWLARGFQIHYAPEAEVLHAHHLSFRTFCRQHFHYGRGAARLQQANVAHSPERRQRRPLSFVLQLNQYLAASERRGRQLCATALLVVAQAAKVTGTVWERAAARWGNIQRPLHSRIPK